MKAVEPPVYLLHTLEGHSDSVLGLRFSANGQYMLSCSQDKSVKLWNPSRGGRAIKTYVGAHNYEVHDVAVVRDNSRFFSVGGDKNAFEWDVASGQVIRKYVGHERKITACCLHEDCLLLTASNDKTVRIWDLKQRQRTPIQVLNDARDSATQVLTVRTEIYVGSVDGCVYRYDVRMGCMFTDCIGAPVGSVSLSADENCVLVSTLDDTIRLYEKETSEELNRYKGHLNSKLKIASVLSPADDLVCSGSEDGRLCFWELVSGEMVRSVAEGHRRAVPALCYAPETATESVLCSGGIEGNVNVWKKGATCAPQGERHLVPSLPKP